MSRRFGLGLFALSLSVAIAAAPSIAQPDGYGTITGQFVLDGAPPQLKPLVVKGDQTVKNPEVCAKDNVPDDALAVDPATKGIANVFVYMRTAPKDIHPDLKVSKESVVKFDQKGCRFIPHALVLRTDQKIAILSDDPIVHNTHVNAVRNGGQNTTIGSDDREGKTQWSFPLPERLPTKINCDIHPWMTAWWLIVDHPYAAVSGPAGKFTIEKIPAGEHEFMIWQEKSGWVFGPEHRAMKFTVKPDQVTTLTLKVPAANFDKN